MAPQPASPLRSSRLRVRLNDGGARGTSHPPPALTGVRGPPWPALPVLVLRPTARRQNARSPAPSPAAREPNGMEDNGVRQCLTPKASHNKAQGRGVSRAPWVTEYTPAQTLKGFHRWRPASRILCNAFSVTVPRMASYPECAGRPATLGFAVEPLRGIRPRRTSLPPPALTGVSGLPWPALPVLVLRPTARRQNARSPVRPPPQQPPARSRH